jgi:hypothetical protein
MALQHTSEEAGNSEEGKTRGGLEVYKRIFKQKKVRSRLHCLKTMSSWLVGWLVGLFLLLQFGA